MCVPALPVDLDRIVRETFVARVEHHAVLGSTNDRVQECAGQDAGPLPLLVLADRQTAGRGRGANRWWTGPGSLAMSLLLAPVGRASQPVPNGPGGPSDVSSLVGLAAALAVVRTAGPGLPGVEVGLHWPNDVFAAGRKLSGVLAEVLADRRVILGIGVNTNNTAADAPTDLRQSVATLRDLTGATHDATELLVTLLRRLESILAALAGTPEEIARQADALCLQRGRTLTVRTGAGVVTGRCEGIAPDGALVLAVPGGPRRIYSGTVVPGS